MKELKSINFIPIDGTKMPKYAGIATFMKLPHITLEQASNVDIGIVGVPWDGGTTLRPGARHAPRDVRQYSTYTRNIHPTLGVNPFELCNCADLGDVNVNTVNLHQTLDWVTEYYSELHKKGIVPLSVGGDHLVSLPILRGIAKNGPVGMVHFDAHTDMYSGFSGESSFSHGTPFYHAINESLIDPKRTIQIGIRGSLYSEDDRQWGIDKGVTIIDIEDFIELGIDRVVQKIHDVVGSGETYLSFDIDCLDPVYAPGTGTPEIGGFTTREVLQMLRGINNLNLVGADLVEISPPFDQTGNTSLLGASLLFEILCLLAISNK